MQLTDREKIKRIESATNEQQVRVAKAFIREDIDDEDVQYLFNTDTLEEMLDSETKVENQNAEAPQGIGAEGFMKRTWKPYDNLNFITTGAGGWNTCIKGYPTDSQANVLSNCVGYASGRFNEIINDARDTEGCTYTTLNCNAENFVERAVAAGLDIGDEPRLGAIMCWQKGSLSSGDGAGHVAIVEEVYDNNSVYTSESAYGGTAFYNSTRTNNNGRWGMSGSYSFRCFIYLPDDVQSIIEDQPQPTPPEPPQPTPTPTYKYNIGDTVVISGDLYSNANAASPVGHVNYKVTTITRKVEAAHPYNTEGDLGWMDEDSISLYSQPVEAGLQVGDDVRIIGTGNGNSLGTGATAYGIGWQRQILKIWDDRPYPYQVGNSSGTTGFYTEDALEKI